MILVQIILGILGIVSFVWLIVGAPIGLIWLLIHMASKNKKEFPWKKWAILAGGGLALMPIIFSLYAVMFIVRSVFGVGGGPIELPKITPEQKFINVYKPEKGCSVWKTCNGVDAWTCPNPDSPVNYLKSGTMELLESCGGMPGPNGYPAGDCPSKQVWTCGE